MLFFEVPNLAQALAAVGRNRVVHLELAPSNGRPAYAALHDPEGYNVLLIEAPPADPHDPKLSPAPE